MLSKSSKSSTTQSLQQSGNPKSTVAPTPKGDNKQKALAVKKSQEEALARLPLNMLYIALYIRSDPPNANDFHWGYYLHRQPTGGTKYHIKNLGAGWITDHGPTGGVFKSNFLYVLVQIANVPQARHVQLDQIMRMHDNQVNSIPNVTCRVWVLTILQELIQHGIVRCSNILALQQECLEIGNQHRAAAAQNNQPRPVVCSSVCLF
ncbi:hypothetical protein LOZ12_002527 [Ophidiomyces ophidiicola]|uniref:Uncharacterized protein n=1 Tax=Ophidiomyces ophidiicola TaxID=1387563 RepID=A0ACB8UZL4_9EURO|nr:hypothetical protein LOZ62_003115 [Ophidiomyces ophidiicola]KAI1971991.1 hypothetical protein LOZ56_002679 [Ophidiomyces ophidiicola]KAI2005306.1 hypothetical protein LOZ50_003796 [Ophidiomyces ophidiicola]KAI2017397.1 hypothetical protein LOZ46_004479 [Ophidiomyces ophidiicola]KAI2025349.1 hypothetical protein LOZ45_003414 [Ophidiomyces ophidiicola]